MASDVSAHRLAFRFLWVYEEAAHHDWNKAAYPMAYRKPEGIGLPIFCFRTCPSWCNFLSLGPASFSFHYLQRALSAVKQALTQGPLGGIQELNHSVLYPLSDCCISHVNALQPLKLSAAESGKPSWLTPTTPTPPPPPQQGVDGLCFLLACLCSCAHVCLRSSYGKCWWVSTVPLQK